MTCGKMCVYNNVHHCCSFSIDPVSAIRQYYDILTQQGCSVDMARLAQELAHKSSHASAEGNKKRKL